MAVVVSLDWPGGGIGRIGRCRDTSPRGGEGEMLVVAAHIYSRRNARERERDWREINPLDTGIHPINGGKPPATRGERDNPAPGARVRLSARNSYHI